MREDEFINNEEYCIAESRYSGRFAIQHISRKSAPDLPLCGTQMLKANVFDLFSSANLCERCREAYLKATS